MEVMRYLLVYASENYVRLVDEPAPSLIGDDFQSRWMRPTFDDRLQADLVIAIAPNGATRIEKNRWGRKGKVCSSTGEVVSKK